MNRPAAATATSELDRVLHAAMADDSLELPPPPQVVSEVMRLTRGEAAGSDANDASTTAVAQLIQRDVALAGQVMRVANSALYTRRSPVVTLPQAIAWLGMREIRATIDKHFDEIVKGSMAHHAELLAAAGDATGAHYWREAVRRLG